MGDNNNFSCRESNSSTIKFRIIAFFFVSAMDNRNLYATNVHKNSVVRAFEMEFEYYFHYLWLFVSTNFGAEILIQPKAENKSILNSLIDEVINNLIL